jgi:hypothetical protein
MDGKKIFGIAGIMVFEDVIMSLHDRTDYVAGSGRTRFARSNFRTPHIYCQQPLRIGCKNVGVYLVDVLIALVAL